MHMRREDTAEPRHPWGCVLRTPHFTLRTPHMIIGTCEIELLIPGSRSLKGKRFILKSLKDRLHHRFNVSVAEVDGHDLWQRGILGIAMVSTDVQHADRVLSEVVNFVERDRRVQILRYGVEMR